MASNVEHFTALLLAGAITAGHIEGMQQRGADLESCTAELSHDGVVYVVHVTTKGAEQNHG